jgi:hypothetical protein
MSTSELELELGTVMMTCTREEVAKTLAALLGEMRAVLPRLREDEREVLRRIMSEIGALTVGEVFPDFARESEAHKTLRRLRAAQFVRPGQTGRWNPEVPIEVKPFARLMWDHVGEEEIFANSSAVAMATPTEDVVDLGLAETENEIPQPAVAEQAEEGVVDLGEIEQEKEPAVARSREAGFADDSVLDLGDYDDLCAFAEEELREKR